jgi:hypothetical protein
MRVWAIVALCLASAAAFGQNVQKEIRQAKAGESCAVSWKGCVGWCDANLAGMPGKEDCKQSCSTYHNSCISTGTWSTPLGKVEIRGLPPK